MALWHCPVLDSAGQLSPSLLMHAHIPIFNLNQVQLTSFIWACPHILQLSNFLMFLKCFFFLLVLLFNVAFFEVSFLYFFLFNNSIEKVFVKIKIARSSYKQLQALAKEFKRHLKYKCVLLMRKGIMKEKNYKW